MSSSPFQALAVFGAWTLVHTVIILGYRTVLINTGKAKPNGFGPSRNDNQDTFIGRVGCSHANCVENLVVFTAVLVAHHFAVASANDNEVVTKWAWYIVYARIGQSLFHWWSISEMAVTGRFLFFVTQLVFLARIVYQVLM